MTITELNEIERFAMQIIDEKKIYSEFIDTEKMDNIFRAMTDAIKSNRAYEKSRERIRNDLRLETNSEEKLVTYIDLFKLGYQISQQDAKLFMLQRDLLTEHLHHLVEFKKNLDV